MLSLFLYRICMIALIQRVTQANVIVKEKCVGHIAEGLLVFLAIEKEDSEQKAKRLCEKNYWLSYF